MCGLSGFMDPTKALSESDIVLMNTSITHRGPDSSDYVFDSNKYFNFAFGHQRLSIIDTTINGNQPILYKQFTLVFNGEIYNYKELRSDLISLGYSFSTSTDTEVVIKSFAQWGKNCVHKFHGMWAFAIYDSKECEVHLCRDRIGVKPLHYSTSNNKLVFSSEIKGILATPGFSKEINTSAVTNFFNYGYVPQTECIYSDIQKVLSGQWVTVNRNIQTSTQIYWSVENELDQNYGENLNSMSNVQLTNHCKEVITKAFDYRTVSDVPFGVFLSGGVDSSLVCAILSRECGYNLQTFTVGFDDKKYDESQYAKFVSQAFGTKHTSQILSLNEAKNISQTLARTWDEPFGDASAIPTFLVSHLASQNVKVSLSADGADELFMGYDRYVKVLNTKFWKHISVNEVYLNTLYNLLPFNDKLKREILKKIRFKLSSNVINKYDSLVSEFGNWDLRKLGMDVLKSRYNPEIMSGLSQDQQLTIHELKNYLEGDILCKVDRASMTNSLESREPFLDQTIVKLALNLSLDKKNNGLNGKIILKNLLSEYLPKEFVHKKKQGFGIPIKEWMESDFKSELKQMALKSSKVHTSGSVSNYVLKYTNGNLKFSNRVWYYYVFELWKLEHKIHYDL